MANETQRPQKTQRSQDSMEDLPRPVRSTAGAASFRDAVSVERQFEVIDPTVFENNWFFLGFNTILNWNDLDAGRPGGRRPTAAQ